MLSGATIIALKLTVVAPVQLRKKSIVPVHDAPQPMPQLQAVLGGPGSSTQAGVADVFFTKAPDTTQSSATMARVPGGSQHRKRRRARRR